MRCPAGWPECARLSSTLQYALVHVTCAELPPRTLSGFEAFFARCADEFAQPTGPDIGRIVEIYREHNIDLVAEAPQELMIHPEQVWVIHAEPGLTSGRVAPAE